MSDFLRNVTLRGAGHFSGSRVAPRPTPSILLDAHEPPAGSLSSKSLRSGTRPGVQAANDIRAEAPQAEAHVAEIESETTKVEALRLETAKRPGVSDRVASMKPRSHKRVEDRTEPEAPAPETDRAIHRSQTSDDPPPRQPRPQAATATPVSPIEELHRESRAEEPDESAAPSIEPSVKAAAKAMSPPAPRAQSEAPSPADVAEPSLAKEPSSRPEVPDRLQPQPEAAKVDGPPAAVAHSLEPQADAVVDPDPVRETENGIASGEAPPEPFVLSDRHTAHATRDAEEPSIPTREREEAPALKARLEPSDDIIQHPGLPQPDHSTDAPQPVTADETRSEEPRPVEIRIGTVEISSAPPAPVSQAPTPPSLKGFDDHVWVRNYLDVGRT